MNATIILRCAAAALALVLAACAHGTSVAPDPASETAADPLSVLIRFYQGPLNHLSAVRRGQCPMVPSCAEYARQAIAVHGPLIGWVMAQDRLMRCGRDETLTAETVWVDGRKKYFDPLAANDFWWRDR